MIKWIRQLFCGKKINQLKQEIENLKSKVNERQEQINKTNAYYKKIIRNIKNNTKK